MDLRPELPHPIPAAIEMLPHDRWKILLQVRHYDHAYRLLGLSFADFEQTKFTRDGGDPTYPSGDYYIARDGKFRVSAFVDDWGHSCRLVEYVARKVELLELAAIHERIALELRVEAVANRLFDERHPEQKKGWQVKSLVEMG